MGNTSGEREPIIGQHNHVQENDHMDGIPSNEKTGNIRETLKGILIGVLYVISNAVAAVPIQLLERAIPDIQLNAMRYGTGAICYFALLLWKQKLPRIPNSEIPSVLLFAFLTTADSTIFFASFSLLPASTVTSVIITAQMLSGLILLPICGVERITVSMVTATLICITGVFLVVQPDFVFPKESDSVIGSSLSDKNNGSLFLQRGDGTLYTKLQHNVTQSNSMNETVSVNLYASLPSQDEFRFVDLLKYLLAIGGGITLTFCLLLLKLKPYFNENLFDVLFWFWIIGTILSTLASALFESPVLPETLYEVVLLLIHCSGIVIVWPLYVLMCKLLSGQLYNIIYSTTVVILLVPQYTILSSILPGNKNWIEVVGAFFVLFGSALGSIIEIIKNK